VQPTILLADPSVRLAGARISVPRWRVDAPTRALGPTSRLHRGRIALAAAALIAVCALGFLRTWPPLATVMSASMAPTINTGDMVVLKKLDGAPRVGDIVTVSVPAEARNRFGYPPVVIHRIVRIDARGVVTTKGDAYEKVDPFDVPSSALSTKVVATVPAAGRVFAFLGSTLGLLWLAGGALLLVGMPMLDRYRDAQRRGLDERDDVLSALQSVTEELARLRADRLDDRERLLAQIERAVAAATPAPPPPPPPAPLPPGPFGCVPASQWKPPTPDVMAILRPAAKTPSEIFRLPVDFVPACSS
jgi:signal peptidase I